MLSLNLLSAAAAQREKRQAAPAATEADAEILALIEARTAAKKAKNYAEADRIREQLKAMGIALTDTPQGVQWSRI